MPSGSPPRYCSCGTRLAQNNRHKRCEACLYRDSRRIDSAPDPPASFWTTDQLRDAFSRQHIGLISAAYRANPYHRRPISQERLGSWLGLTQAQVSRIESGPPIRDLDRLTHWTRTLRIPTHLLWFDLPGERRSPSSPAARLPPSPPWPGTSAHTWPPGTPNRGTTTLETIRAAAMAFRAADRQMGGGALYPVVARYLQTEVGPRLVSQGQQPAAVFSAASSLTDLAGWLAYDDHHRERAGQHFVQAFALATAADDQALGAQALVSQSHLALEHNRPSDAVQLADAGLAITPDTPGCAHLRARLLAMRARGSALLGDETSTAAALHRADTELARAQPGDHEWLSPFDEASLAAEAAICLRDLGRFSEAIERAEQVLRLRTVDRVRSRAFSQLTLAGVYLAQGDLDSACSLGDQVLDVIPTLDSSRVAGQLRRFGGDLQPHAAAGPVRGFLGRLAATVPPARMAQA